MYCKHKPARKEISLASKCKSLCLVYCVMFPINPGALPAGKERGGRQEAFGECSCSEKVPRLRAPGGCRCSGPAPAARELRKELPSLPLHSTPGPGSQRLPPVPPLPPACSRVPPGDALGWVQTLGREKQRRWEWARGGCLALSPSSSGHGPSELHKLTGSWGISHGRGLLTARK